MSLTLQETLDVKRRLLDAPASSRLLQSLMRQQQVSQALAAYQPQPQLRQIEDAEFWETQATALGSSREIYFEVRLDIATSRPGLYLVVEAAMRLTEGTFLFERIVQVICSEQTDTALALDESDLPSVPESPEPEPLMPEQLEESSLASQIEAMWDSVPEAGPGAEHLKVLYPLPAWRAAVAQGQTIDGYFEWVLRQHWGLPPTLPEDVES